jgi:hypothetical protein
MNHFDMMLAARSFKEGRALRSSSKRHRRFVARALALVVWQMAGEPFSAAALGWGCSREDLTITVAGEPRDRELACARLRCFARWFNPWFESPADDCEIVTKGDYSFRRARTAPQVLVANTATVEALGHLGRRLAHLPSTNAKPADETLLRLGRHLSFLHQHASVPGQQVLITLTDLLNDHWMTAQSDVERQSLAALDAWIAPPAGLHGFTAAAAAEERPVGPVPPGEWDEELEPLVESFNEKRAGRTERSVVEPLLGPIEKHYRALVEHTWELLWRCRERELAFAEAPSVGRRWAEDRKAYTSHIDWVMRCGLRRVRQTPRQATTLQHRLEEAGTLLAAEEACDDPVRMIPWLLENKAVRGLVVGVDPEHKEKLTRMVRRPLVTLRSPDVCLMPVGKELYWSDNPSGREYVVHALEPASGRGSLITLKLMTGSDTDLPALGTEACFSIHSTSPGYVARLPKRDPWTHSSAPAALESIED